MVTGDISKWRRWRPDFAWPTWVAGAVVGAVIGSLLWPIHLPFDGRLIKAMETAAHFPLFFGGVMAWLFLTKPVPSWPGLRLLGVGVMLSAVALELAQLLTHRDPNLLDTFFSTLGGWSAVLIWYSLHTRRRGLILGAWSLCALLALLVGLPSLLILADRAHAHLTFPLLASFEGRSELGRWWGDDCRLARVKAQSTHGEYAMRVALARPRTSYPGVFMTDGHRDWSGHRRLSFDVYLTGGSERILWVRVDDRRDYPPYGDRAQTMVNLVPGANSVSLDLDTLLQTPGGRPLDRTQIRRWGMFFEDAQGGESFFLDHVRLTR